MEGVVNLGVQCMPKRDVQIQTRPVVGLQANSSVAQDALSEEDRDVSVVSSAQDVAPPVPNAWRRTPLPNGTPDAWEEQPAPPPPLPRGPKRRTDAPVKQVQSENKGAAGTKLERQPPPAQKPGVPAPSNSTEGSAPVSVDANGTMDATATPPAPPVPAQPKGPPVSWRKILAGVRLSTSPVHGAELHDF